MTVSPSFNVVPKVPSSPRGDYTRAQTKDYQRSAARRGRPGWGS